MTPEVEIRPTREFAEMGDLDPVYRGHDGYRKIMRDWLPAWGDSFRWQPRELIDCGDRLVVLGEAPVRGQGSGVALSPEHHLVWTLRDGRIVGERHYYDRAEALQAVGLRE
jgi:ketosteroid isomerase-like protein